MGFGWILKVELIELVDGLDVGRERERERGVEDGCRDLDLSNWKDGVEVI